MLYFLDGKINLFDSPKVDSIDAMQSKFTTSSYDGNGEDVIEYYSDTLRNGVYNATNHIDLFRKDTVKTICDLLEASMENMNKMMPYKDKYASHIRMLYAFYRFTKKRDIEQIFKGNSQARFYYYKNLDMIKQYLLKHSKV
jgi:hypothetical protein